MTRYPSNGISRFPLRYHDLSRFGRSRGGTRL